MTSQILRCFVVAGACLAFLGPFARAGGQTGDAAPPAVQLPEGDGRDAVIRGCVGACHGATVIAQPRSKDEWVATVNEMIGLGAQISDEDYVPIVVYLVTHFTEETEES